MERVEIDSKVTLDSAQTHMQEKSAEASSYRNENERIKVGLETVRYV